MQEELVASCTFSQHAESQMRQRGIRIEDVLFMFLFGRRSHLSDERNRHFIRSTDVPIYLVNPQQADRLNGLEVVLSDDGVVITAYYRNCRRYNLKSRYI